MLLMDVYDVNSRRLHCSGQTYADAMDAGTMTLADVLDAATALPVRWSPHTIALRLFLRLRRQPAAPCLFA